MVKCIVINPADNIRAETADAIRCAALSPAKLAVRQKARQARAKTYFPPRMPPLSQRKSRGAHIAPPENRTVVGGFTRWERRSPKTNMFILRNSLPQPCDKAKALDMLARHLGMFSMSEKRSRRPKLSAR
jgi:hypothetical protein